MAERSPKPGPSRRYSHDHSPETTKIKTTEEKLQKEKPEDRIEFRCENCYLQELCDYKGKKPPFVNGIVFLEDCYVMRDPFAPPPFRSRSKSEFFLVLGTHCSLCDKIVCKRSKCSAFYEKTFCLDCTERNLSQFPTEIQSKFKKQLSTIRQNS